MSTSWVRFCRACQKGDLATAQALVEHGVDMHGRRDTAFVWACSNGHLDVVRWLPTQGGVDIHVNRDEAFRWACSNGHLAVAQWLVAQGGVDIHGFCDGAFRWTCHNGHLAVAQWLAAQGGVDIHASSSSGSDNAFRWACDNGHLAVARWLVRLDPSYTQWPANALDRVKVWSDQRAAWVHSVAKPGDSSAIANALCSGSRRVHVRT